MPLEHTPEPHPEGELPQREEPAPFLAESPALHEALAIPDTPENWKKLLESFAKELPNPRGDDEQRGGRPRVEDAVILKELERRYLLLGQRRRSVSDGLYAILRLKTLQQPISPAQRSAVLRNLTQYLDDRDVYEHLWTGTVADSPALPEYLAPYVRTPLHEQFVLRTTKAILPLQYDVREKVSFRETPRALTPLAQEIALSAVRSQVRLPTVLACLQSDDTPRSDLPPYEAFLRLCGYPTRTKEGLLQIPEKDLQAAKLLIGYVGKHLPAIRRYAETLTEGDLERLTVGDALELSLPSAALGEAAQELVLQLPSLLTGKLPPVRETMERILKNKDQYAERTMHLLLAPLAELQPDAAKSTREEFQRNAKAVTEFFLSSTAESVRVRQADHHIQHLNEAQKRMVRSLCDRAVEEKAIARILQACFIPPENERDAMERNVAAALTRLLRERSLSLRDAFDLYYLSGTESIGSVPLALKAVELLEKHGEVGLAADLQFSRLRMFVDFAQAHTDEVTQALSALQLTDAQRREIENIRLYIRDEGLEALENWWDRLRALTKEFPAIMIPLEIAAVSGFTTPLVVGGLAVRRQYIKARTGALVKFAAMSDQEALLFATKHRVPVEHVRLAQREVSKLVTEYQRLDLRFHLLQKGKLRKQGHAILRAARELELTDMTKVLRRRYPHIEDVTQILREVAPDEMTLHESLRKAGYTTDEIRRGLRTTLESGQVGQPVATTPESLRLPSPREARALEAEEKLLKTRPGQFAERLQALRQSRAVRIGGRVLRIGGATLPAAAAAYEIYENEKRAREAAGNPELQRAIRSRHLGTVLEGGTVTLGFIAGNGPGLLALGTLYPAKEYAEERAAVREGWARGAEDWLKVLDAADLHRELAKRAPGKELEGGGGGMFRPRGSIRATPKDQQEAFELLEKTNRIARKNLTEALLYRTLPLPLWARSEAPSGEHTEEERREEQETRQAVMDRMVPNAMRYLELVTQGEYSPVTSEVLEQARIYAQLCERCRILERAGVPAILRYEDRDGKIQSLDLGVLPHLHPETGTPNDPQETRTTLERYYYHVLPEEELTSFKAFGLLAKESRGEAGESARQLVRHSILQKLIDAILRAEARIRETNFPGLEITGSEQEAENLARALLRKRVEGELSGALPPLLEGSLSREGYQALSRRLKVVLQEDPLPLHQRALQELSEEEKHRAKREGRHLLLGIVR